MSRYVFFFLKRGGEALGTVTDTNSRISPITNGGTKIQMALKFQHANQQLINKLMEFIATYDYDYKPKPLREPELYSEDGA